VLSHRRGKIGFEPKSLLVDFTSFHFRLIRRQTFNTAGGIDPNYKVGIDYDLCLRLAEMTKFRHLAEPLYDYRIHEQQLSKTRRLEQIRFSARAIRSALRRRGLDAVVDLDVREESETFRLILRRSASMPRWSDHLRWCWRTLIGQKDQITTTQRQETTVGLWPYQGNVRSSFSLSELLQSQLTGIIHEHGVQTLALGSDLPALMRLIWSGNNLSTVHVATLRPILTPSEPGAVRALELLFFATVRRLRAQNGRWIWMAHDLDDPRFLACPQARKIAQRFALQCDSVICHSLSAFREARLLGVNDQNLHWVSPGNFIDRLSDLSATQAKELCANSNDFMVLIWCEGLSAQEIKRMSMWAMQANRYHGAQLMFAGHGESPVPQFKWLNLAQSSLREVSTWITASDAIVAPRCDDARSLTRILVCSLARPLVTPIELSTQEITHDTDILPAYLKLSERLLERQPDLKHIGIRNLKVMQASNWRNVARTMLH